MWFKFKSYFLFLIHSKNKHGIHSPFVYKLVTKCFNKKLKKEEKTAFLEVRKWLLKSNKIIHVTDYGNGSKIFKSNFRKVSKISKVAAINPKKAYLLTRICTYLKVNYVLEIGTSIGLSSSAMALSSKDIKIDTIEGCSNTSKIASEVFKKFHLNKNIRLINNTFEKSIPELLENTFYDLIYFDGNHSKNATLKYFNWCLANITENSIFIFDDINYSEEMNEAWNEIRSNNKVTVSINTYFWGLVFFKTTQAKQHFNIRV
ncbi:MAG: O-methyltransferase [Lutibacter sp.]